MPDQPSNHDPLQESGTQVLVLLQLLREEQERPHTRAALGRELDDIDPAGIEIALERLREHGVVNVEGERLAASDCARHIDALDMIGI